MRGKQQNWQDWVLHSVNNSFWCHHVLLGLLLHFRKQFARLSLFHNWTHNIPWKTEKIIIFFRKLTGNLFGCQIFILCKRKRENLATIVHNAIEFQNYFSLLNSLIFQIFTNYFFSKWWFIQPTTQILKNVFSSKFLILMHTLTENEKFTYNLFHF